MIHFEIPENPSSLLKVIGVGGGGGNAVNHMYKNSNGGVDFIVCNTDSQALSGSPVGVKIQLGPHLTQGLGAGANPEIGEKATHESLDEVKRILELNTKMAFITAGMGGGTGTGGAPVIASLCKDLGILTVGIVTTPFVFEGRKRMQHALDGIKKLREYVDTVIIISNDKLREQCGNLSYKEAFSKADDIVSTAASCITDVINTVGQINVDFADVNTVMRNGGVAILGNAIEKGENRAQKAVESALTSPLLNHQDIKGAKWVLLNITTSDEHPHTMDDISIIQDIVQARAGMDCEVILGMGSDNELGEALSVTLIATGFEHGELENEYGKLKQKKKDESKVVFNLDENKISLPVDTNPLENGNQSINGVNSNDGKIIYNLESAAETPIQLSVNDLFGGNAHSENIDDEQDLQTSITDKIASQFHELNSDDKLLDIQLHKMSEENHYSSAVNEDSAFEKRCESFGIPAKIGERELTREEREEKLKLAIQQEIFLNRAKNLQTLNSNDLINPDKQKFIEEMPAYIRRNNNQVEQQEFNPEGEDFYSGYRIKKEDINNNNFISSINTFLFGKQPD